LENQASTELGNLPQALAGLRIIDAATLFAGPYAAAVLADLGADVIKVEHPQGDPSRRYGARQNGVPLWWKVFSRNKRCATLHLGTEEGQHLFRRLAATADVVVENFRPGTMERWGLGYEALSRDNPRLVLVRVTTFGQGGPYADRPGFGTLAEAMSGLASMVGEPDGPPTLPSFPLGDAVAGLNTAFATLAALQARAATGVGQVVDMSIVDTLVGILGGFVTTHCQTGAVPRRSGNRSPNNAPRNIYRTKDDCWVAVSTSTQTVAERVMTLIGREDLLTQPWFATGAGRAEHVAELDEAVGGWIAQRTRDQVIEQFAVAEAAAAPVYEIPDLLGDPQIVARGLIQDIDDPELGNIRMPGLPFRMSRTPGSVRWAGPPIGAHNTEIFAELGLTPSDIDRLRGKEVL
jgi:crotonobetainyl-CoA:carnitine CoA-transferase CaiB-like acyl-CoA transferase